ncbi:MAG: hypothetical protein LBU18_01090 [Treponema sp.]|nr:hypothetical protein [Treponema sp.]
MKAGVFFSAAVFLLAAALTVHAQDDFGFGFGFSEDEGGAASSGNNGSASIAAGASVHGKAQAELLFFAEEFRSKDAIGNIQPGNIFSGELNFSAGGSNADGVINLKLRPDFQDPAKILSLDEAYVRAFFGNFNIEGGLRKLTWGKADSLGPLDVINPLDYSDLSAMSDVQSIKISRPLLHASYSIGPFTKIEGVFVPWFEGHRFAHSGRWAASQMTEFQEAVSARFAPQFGMLPGLGINDPPPSIDSAQVTIDTSTLEYAQGGLRFTTTAGSSDIGVQYYSGFLPRPAVVLNQQGISDLTGNIASYAAVIFSSGTSDEDKDSARNSIRTILASLKAQNVVATAYNRCHQIGLDYAQVIAGFNLRAEMAANITEDLKGDDGLVYNPSVAWSLGFDRDIAAGINVNLQVNENIMLLNNKTDADILNDIEAGSDVTDTRLTLTLSKKFLRDELELRATGIWGIEDMDYYILPALIWTKGDTAVELSGGVFAGNPDGGLGQYRDNGFIKAALSCSF